MNAVQRAFAVERREHIWDFQRRRKVQIHSYKHNGSIHRMWEETTILKGTQSLVIGANDRTVVTESDTEHGLLVNQQFAIFMPTIGLM